MNKRVIQLILIGFFCQFLTSCSWVERFAIFNFSENSILINYTIDSTRDGIPIFDKYVQFFELNKNNTIEWEKELTLKDMDTNSHSFSFKVPSNSAFIFGELHNDTYEKFDAKYINGYRFNLTRMEVIKQTETVSIIPENFDSLFEKKKGFIGYSIK